MALFSALFLQSTTLFNYYSIQMLALIQMIFSIYRRSFRCSFHYNHMIDPTLEFRRLSLYLKNEPAERESHKIIRM